MYQYAHRKLQPEDIAGVEYLYGPPAIDSDGPMPLWADIAIGVALLGSAARRTLGRKAAPT